MAESPYEVESFLVDLAHRAKPAAQADLDELKAFAKQRDGLDDFSQWDAPYYAEKLKEKKLCLYDEELRPYFAFDKVVSGLARKSVVEGKSVSVRVDLGGRRIIKKKN